MGLQCHPPHVNQETGQRPQLWTQGQSTLSSFPASRRKDSLERMAVLWTVHPDLLVFPEESCCGAVYLGFSGENKQGEEGGAWGREMEDHLK